MRKGTQIVGTDYSLVGTQPFVYAPKETDVPYTEIVGRAKIPNLADDLSANFGINRITCQDVYLIQDEFGPNGESVYGVVNDSLNQVRLVGSWPIADLGWGTFHYTQTQNAYIEIVFYGTGLNLVTALYLTSDDMSVSVDGGAYGSDILTGNYSAILTNRGYTVNSPVPVTSGLSAGIHTVKIRNNSGGTIRFQGFEVLNETASLVKVNPGISFNEGQSAHAASTTDLTYNSGFETGTLGTKGGHVLVYQKSDGSVAHAVTPTDTTALYLGSTDHSNEEVIRRYNFREFGAGRSDDFSELGGSTQNSAFTLDDGTTTLVGDDIGVLTSVTGGLYHNTIGDSWTLTFVGTGLDIITAIASVSTTTYNVDIDGTNQGTITHSNFTSANTKTLVTIASGLSYGTHIVKVTRQATAQNISTTDFIVYGPKKPTLPTGATELASYYVMADFATSTNGLETVATGVLRKDCTREFVYVGTGHSVVLTPTECIGGFKISSTTSGNKFLYTFYGTGFELRWRAETGRSNNNTVKVDDTLLTSSNFLGATFTDHGLSTPFNPTTGILDMRGSSVNGAGFRASGLDVGLHVLEVTSNDTGAFIVEAIDVITPIHSPKSNLPANLQNTLPVGSCAVGDLRKFSIFDDNADLPNFAKAVGVQSDPTTTATSGVPMPDMAVVLKTKGNLIEVEFSALVSHNSVPQATYFDIVVDGVKVGHTSSFNATGANARVIVEVNDIVEVGPGTHHVAVLWWTTAGTVTASGGQRRLTVKESK